MTMKGFKIKINDRNLSACVNDVGIFFRQIGGRARGEF